MIRIKDVISNGLTEDYPERFNKQEFNSIKSFQGKLDYAVRHLKKIASGSARVVFMVDDGIALKIAKNKKGLAQNKVEADKYLQNYDITAKVYDSDKNHFWLEMELAKKLTPTRFKNLTGVSIEDLDRFLMRTELLNSGRKLVGRYEIPEDELNKLSNNEFIMDLTSLVDDMNLPVGDLSRISSFGEVVQNGKPTVVLVDFGLTQEVFDDYYKVK